jgi:hypothetical protein
LPFRTAMDLLDESKGSDNQSNKETEWPLWSLLHDILL